MSLQQANSSAQEPSKLEIVGDYVMKNFDIIQGTCIDLSDDDAVKLSKALTDSPTVYSRTADELKEHAKKFGCILLKDKSTGDPIGYITVDIYTALYKGKSIHERISLWVDDKFQDKGYGIYLMDLMTKEYINEPIVSCTLNSKVGHINTGYLNHKEINRDQIPEDLFQILEIPGPLSDPNYRFYVNDCLYLLMKTENE